MTVYKNIDFSEGLTEEQIEMLRKAEASPIVFDEDCPELTDEQLAKFTRVSKERQQKLQGKQTVSVVLSQQAIAKAQSLGKEYTAILSKILEKALADNEVIKNYLQDVS